ncbi:hypothetical protein P3X46_033351 [Hevea brasiliensis]|uniref:Uncharacterized protein n=1 Tax=Hevea brasiliensis TaxID=3981 RepID=A0ABQ9KHF2_HEVBR|nr:hypothetical protein P3X46_033351 [Hevea brasiliensis]
MEGLHRMEDKGETLYPFASGSDLFGCFSPLSYDNKALDPENIDVSGELQFYSLCGQQFPLEGFHIVEDNKANKYPIWHEEPVHSYNCHDDLFKYPAFWSDEYQVTEENNSGLSELSGGVIQSLCEHPRPLMEDLYTANDKREVEGRAHPFEDCPPWYDGNQISGEVQFLWDYQVSLEGCQMAEENGLRNSIVV